MNVTISRRWLLGAGGLLALTVLPTSSAWTQRRPAITVYKNPT